MAVPGSLSVLIGAQLGPLKAGLQKAGGMVQGWAKKTSAIISNPAAIGGMVGGASGSLAVGLFKNVANSVSGSQEALVKLQATLSATGNAAQVDIGRVIKLADDMADETRYTASSTLEAAAAIAQLGTIKGGNLEHTLKVSHDLAAFMGSDLPQAASQLASALHNPKEGYLELAKAGFNFTASTVDQIQHLQAMGDVAGAQRLILNSLQRQIEGVAKAAAGTGQGILEVNKNKADQAWLAAKTLGIESMNAAGKGLEKFSDRAIEAQGEITKLIDSMNFGNADFRLPDFMRPIAELKRKGATQGQVDQAMKAGGALRGKELLRELELPIDTFKREMQEIAALKDVLDPREYETIRKRKTAEFFSSLPEFHVSAGGAMERGSAEARSAILAQQNVARNNDPAARVEALQEAQKKIEADQLIWLRKIEQKLPTLAEAPRF